jgi:hypothetical protein
MGKEVEAGERDGSILAEVLGCPQICMLSRKLARSSFLNDPSPEAPTRISRAGSPGITRMSRNTSTVARRMTGM